MKTRIWQAFINIDLAVYSNKTSPTVTLIGTDVINATSIVEARSRHTFIYIYFTSITCVKNRRYNQALISKLKSSNSLFINNFRSTIFIYIHCLYSSLHSSIKNIPLELPIGANARKYGYIAIQYNDLICSYSKPRSLLGSFQRC